MYREPTLLNPTWRRLVFTEYASLNDEALPHVAAGRQLLSNQHSVSQRSPRYRLGNNTLEPSTWANVQFALSLASSCGFRMGTTERARERERER